jgi:O-methyltransferase
MTAPIDLYLDLMILSLTDLIHDRDDTVSLNDIPFRREVREEGHDWPVRAHTMIGVKRLENIRYCAEEVFRSEVPGDFMETGVWRGGATIFMRAVLAAYQRTDKRVWVADSFAGLPEPDAHAFPADRGDQHHTHPALAASLPSVKENFARYNLLDDQVVFLEGWFRDTLPTCGVEALSLLRLDGDMYESTIVALDALYPRLMPGGFLIVDDYGAVPACRKAVDEYRTKHGIADAIVRVDWTGVYWRKGG